MNLILDQGNTALKIGILENGELLFAKSYISTEYFSVLADLEKYKVSSCIISKVAPIHASIQNYLDQFENKIELNQNTALPIKNLYQTPETLGNDRLANAVGANLLFPDRSVLVIDMGTCIKYDLINADAEYLGGAISPGIQMRYQAMHDFTGQLPLLSPISEVKLIGDTTASSIHAGVIHGVNFEMNATIDLYRNQYKNLVVILTGGDSRFFLNTIKTSIFAEPSLTLKGLDAILRFNQ